MFFSFLVTLYFRGELGMSFDISSAYTRRCRPYATPGK